jgi:hypothetical protein
MFSSSRERNSAPVSMKNIGTPPRSMVEIKLRETKAELSIEQI